MYGFIVKSACHIRITTGCCLGLCLLLISTGAQADKDIDLYNMSLPELMQLRIQAASFFDRTAAQSPGYSWVFTQKDITNSPIEYVKDFFDFYAPGTTISQTHFSGATTGVRGIATSNNAKTIVMSNGQSLNQKSHYGYQVGLQSTLFGDIDHIEVINGPGAMLHGSGAINGIVNIIQKNGKDNPGFHSDISHGFKEGLNKFEAGYGGSYGENKYYYLYAGIAEANGFNPDSFLELGSRQDVADDPGIDENHNTYKLNDNYRLAGYFVHENWRFQSQIQQVKRSLNGPVQEGLPVASRQHWQTFWASRLKYTFQWQTDTSLELSVPTEFFDHGINFDDDEGDKGGRESHIALQTILHQEWAQHMLAIGTGIGRRDFDPQKQYFESDKPLLEESMDGHLTEMELFAEDIWQLNDQFSLLFGMRYDKVHYSSFYDPESNVRISVQDLSALTKRIAANYQIDKKKTIKISYEEGFRYPDIAYFLYLGIANSSLMAANLATLPELREETVKSYEINYLHELHNIPMTWDFNIYYNIHKGTLDWQDYSVEFLGQQRYDIISDAIGFSPGSFTNAGGSYQAYGFEIVNRWLPTERTSVRTSYGFSRPSGFERGVNQNLELVNESNNRWGSYPEHLLKLAIDHGFKQGFTFNLTAYYAASVDICALDCDVQTAAEKFHKQDRIRINSKLRYIYNKHTNLSVVVQNLFADDGPAVGNSSRGGTGALGGLGDDARRVYLSVAVKY